MTPLVFGSAGMLIDDDDALPSSAVKSRRRLIEQQSVSRRQRRIAGHRIGREQSAATRAFSQPAAR
jgi:hypothetical protein